MKCPLCEYRARPACSVKAFPKEIRLLKRKMMVDHVIEAHPGVARVNDGYYYCGCCGGGYLSSWDLYYHWVVHGPLVDHLLEGKLR